jgi:outer membrane immunogenic protein
MRHAASALALIAGLGMAGSAQAAGWNGFYIGANIGYGQGDVEQRWGTPVGTPLTVTTNADLDQDGWIGGAHFGNSWRLGSNWVTGFEGEWDYSNVNGDDGGSGGIVTEASGNWEAAVLWRLGVLLSPKTQLYGLGGYGWYNADITNYAGLPESKQATFTGWTWGFGFERECAPDMTWGIRYRTTDYDEERVSFPVLNDDYGLTPSIREVSFRMSWRL